MNEIVDFTPDAVRAYIDRAITQWRRSEAEHSRYYVDAFQSVRVSLFGELLAPEDPP